MKKCPVCGMSVDENFAPSFVYQGKKYFFMNAVHKEMFKKDPKRFLKH